MEAAIQYLKEHPEEAPYTDSAATAIWERGLRVRAEGPGGALVVSDMPEAVGGEGSSPSPGWLMRAALAACDATLIAMKAAQEGVELTTLEVTVDSESDDRGLLGIDDKIHAGPLNMRTRIRIEAPDAPEEKLREIARWAEAHSPVADAICRSVPSKTEVEISSTERRAG
ncbi:MAG TPA: OsmC family protein [Chloroflexota bacterium]